jgi:hypothetical protein
MLVAPLAGALDRYEINCDLTAADGRAPSFHFTACDAAENSAIMASCFAMGRFTGAMLKGRNSRVNMHDFDLTGAFHDLSTRVNLRAFVDAKAGTVDTFLDGIPVSQVGRVLGEQCPGIFGFFEIGPQERQSAAIFSNLRIAPWSGELPRPGDEPCTLFANGDVTRGAIGEVRDGKLAVKSEIGDVEMPMDKVVAMEFAGAFAPVAAVGRILFQDGSIINVDRFRWTGSELSAHSATLGDFRLPASAVRELVLHPSLPRAPHPLEPRKKEKTSEQKE